MEQPTLESINTEEVKEQLLNITEETTKEELYGKIDFLVKQLNLAHEQNRRNTLLLLESLEKAQSRYKNYEAAQKTWKYRLKLAIKKVMIGWGWYEASYDELKEIHFGKARDAISQQ